MARVYNFSAGPSMLPEEVLKTAAEEMMEYGYIRRKGGSKKEKRDKISLLL